MKKIGLFVVCISLSIMLSSCVTSTQDQINDLQLTQKQLQNKASESLANIQVLKDKVVKYRAEADELQKKSDKMDKDISDLKVAYGQFEDPNNDSAIAVNSELVSKVKQKVDIDEKINKYRSQANTFASQITQLKATSQTQANQASKISSQIAQLSSKK
ncbi:hypothetical protein FLM55_04650 [Francisella sp. Scap27]|uniref:hypothetical protein n=1 Tax=Francisella sp. Scap27 TaxID=2589986 RepID=UPI0015BD9256|nr:hypothetical protein [Francisella sp. Scap27]QLE79062.1 hypothetical protein FLM55_04650 [Francisella sp. Scap27]